MRIEVEVRHKDELLMNIMSLRKRSGYTLSQASDKLGISKHMLMKWEKDSSLVPAKYIDVISELYHYPKQLIFFGDNIGFSDIVHKNK